MWFLPRQSWENRLMDLGGSMSGEMISILLVAARFTKVAVELKAGNRIFTTLPVVPVQR